ncbi:hypothetical protein FACS18948_4060 [Clostridia bacterium]|nr:hypothetical protein FACS18948_4060 [Clostridia bacterium]
MSFGKMSEQIDIIQPVTVIDPEGFGHQQDNILFSARAYKEEKHGTEKWANLSTFSTASAMFRMRKPPVIIVTSQMVIVCPAGRYRILSVDDVRGRGRYLEILAEKIEPTMR